MQRKASEARRLHSQQTIKVARLSQPIKVGVTQRGGGKRKGGRGEGPTLIICNYNFSIAGSSVFDTQSSESGDNTLYEDSCETDSNDTIYNKSRSDYYSMLRLDTRPF